MSFFLTDHNGKVIELDKPELLIGRDLACDIVIPQKGVSMLHASLRIESERARIEDISSLNGTFVNGNRIAALHWLQDGDAIEIDDETFTFHIKSNRDETNQTLVRTNQRPVQNQNMSAEYHTIQTKFVGGWAVGLGSKDAGTVIVPRDEINQILLKAEPRTAETLEIMLFVSNGSYQGLTFQLMIDEKNVWEIGKGKHCDIIIEHPSVSESHAKLAFVNQQWRIIDQLSLNGVFINGAKTLDSFIKPGTEFHIGPVECKLIQLGDQTKPGGAIRSWLRRWITTD